LQTTIVMPTISVLHWNDVYRVTPQKICHSPPETIDVTQFGAMVDDIRNRWPARSDGTRDGLVLFSGDVFSPSVESSVTRGSHMVDCMRSHPKVLSVLNYTIGPCHERVGTRCLADRCVLTIFWLQRANIVQAITTLISGIPTCVSWSRIQLSCVFITMISEEPLVIISLSPGY
jgi:hypothetical protein